MQPTSLLFPRKLSYPLATKALMIALSIGVHYLVASNLGIFSSSSPVRLKPSGGTVKVVELTPAERTRVPEAAKSDPLPISQSPIDPAPANRSSFGNVPTPRSSSVSPSPSSPSVNPVPSASRTQQPSSSPSRPPSSAPTPPSPKSSSLGINRNNRFSQMPTDSGEQSGGDNGSQPSNPNPPGVNRSPGSSTKPNQPSGSSGKPSSPPPTTPPLPPSPSGEGLSKVKQRFDQQARTQINATKATVVERRIPVPQQSYPGIQKCSREQNGYIEVGIGLSDADDATATTLSLLEMSSALGEKLGNPFVGKVFEQADGLARNDFERRTEAQKQADRGKIVLYRFTFEFDRNTCRTQS